MEKRMPPGAQPAHWNAYRIKRTILAPYLWYMRRRFRHVDGFAKQALEITYYRPAVFRFFEAMTANPDMLHEAPNLSSDSVVFDVGGFDGDWSARVFQKYQPRIYCFEVSPALCQALETRFASNPKIQCLAYGLSGANARLPLSLRDMGSTLYAEAGDLAANGEQTVNVPVRDIVEVIDEFELNRIDLLKLNIEGGEYDVLERLIQTGRMRDVACLNIQFHEWLNRAAVRRHKIRQALKRTHRQTWSYPWCWEQWVRQ